MFKRVIISLVILIVIIYSITFVVPAGKYAVLTQFGKPVRIIKAPGLYFKLPFFLQTVNYLDAKIDVFTTQPIQLLLGDKNPVILSCFICWKIDNPLLFLQSLSTRVTAEQKISDMINSYLGSTLGDYSIENIINTLPENLKLEQIESTILTNANTKSKQEYGIEIVSVGIRRILYPSIVAESVYLRMRAEREKEARKFRAEGQQEAERIRAEADKEVSRIISEAYKEAEIIKGQGDKEAFKTYASVYAQEPEFFEFLKSLDTYQEILKNKSTLILSTRSELFKYLSDYKQK
ncbi:MAG: protease modulator HflC [Candidatus Hydrogenedentota bacterium]